MRGLRLSRLPAAWLIAAFALVATGPLLLLATFSITRSTDAVTREAEARVRSNATVGAVVLEREGRSLAELVDSYAKRPTLIRALGDGDRTHGDKNLVALTLRQLRGARSGIAIAFLADDRGILVEIEPSTPSIVGLDFSYRDWYRGVTATGRPYVSEAYTSAARGHPRVVAAAAPVRSGGRTLGILVAAYGLGYLQGFVDRFAASQGVGLTVTDQHGIVLAAPDAPERGLVSLRDDARVAAALAGRSGTADRAGPEMDELSAYTPVPGLGWTVTASVPRTKALASVSHLRSTVITIALVLALVLAAGLALLGRVLRQREHAERRTEQSHTEAVDARRLLAERNEELEALTTELESQNTELELQTAELEVRQAQLESANDELEAQRVALETVLGELEVEKRQIEMFSRFAELLAAETDSSRIGSLILHELCDVALAEVGTLYAATDEESESLALAATRGLRDDLLARELRAGDGLAGRALEERRRVLASHGETGLVVPAFGEHVAIAHELHLPLVHAQRPIGVLTVARVADPPFAERELEALEQLAAQAAVGLANALSFEAALRQAGITRATIEATVDGIGMFDVAGGPVFVNAAYERLMSEIAGEPARMAESAERALEVSELVAQRVVDPPGYRTLVARALANPGAVIQSEYQLAESSRSFRRDIRPVHDLSGELIGRLVVVREVTKEREAERLKSELVATVSHELRTPLTGILGFAELLLRKDFDRDQQRDYLGTIHREAKRLTNLINDFLDVQRIESGSLSLAREPFDLVDVLREQIALFGAEPETHVIVLEVPQEPIVVTAERERVVQVVANLLSNAIKYSPAGGRVVVAAEERAGCVRVSVSDSGIGIPADQQAGIFTKFFRVDSSDTRRIGGTGLGLALSREIVDAHGGRIDFTSAEGSGSTFWFELPLVTRAEGPGARVLVIEDDPSAATLLSELLAEDGHSVLLAPTGEEGLRLAREDVPDLVCLDIGLPGELDGWQVLARLKAGPATADVPVVVCTAGNGRNRAAALGAADFLTKPISTDRLLSTIARLAPGGRGCVLVVDDDPTVRRLVVDTLANGKLELREAADGEEALASVAERRPDAIVLDLVMPGLDGFEVLDRLQREPTTRLLPVVVLTAHDLSPGERQRLRGRAVSLLRKASFSTDELRALVRSALAA